MTLPLVWPDWSPEEWRRRVRALPVQKYRPDQAREPEGSPIGGRFAYEGGGSGGGMSHRTRTAIETPDRGTRAAWIAPEGRVVAVSQAGGHLWAAAELVGSRRGPARDAEMTLYDEGWVRYDGDSFDGPAARMTDVARWVFTNQHLIAPEIAEKGWFYYRPTTKSSEWHSRTLRLVTLSAAALRTALTEATAVTGIAAKDISVYHFDGTKLVSMKADALATALELAEKFNPYHEPAGSPEGGQFTTAPGGGALAASIIEDRPPMSREERARWRAEQEREKERQREFERDPLKDRRASSYPKHLAEPDTIIGCEDLVATHDVRGYLKKHGQEWKAAPRPDDVAPRAMGDCYRNATLLMLTRPDLDYCEGLAYPPDSPDMPVTKDIGFMHAWCVTKDGTVVDPTWPGSEGARYFGVRYPRNDYLASIMLPHNQKIAYYGVLAGTVAHASRVMRLGRLPHTRMRKIPFGTPVAPRRRAVA